MTSKKLLEKIEKELVTMYDNIDTLLNKIANHLEEKDDFEEDLVDREAEDDFNLNFKDDDEDDEEY